MSIESGHWYTVDGKAAHTQPTKTKGAKPIRSTTLADAKRLGLLPSVSAYTRMLEGRPYATDENEGCKTYSINHACRR